MGAVIPVGILGYEGQVIKEVRQDEATGKVTVVCRRDRRHRPVDSKNGRAGPINRWLRRTVRDIPLGGRPCEVEIEYAQVFLSPSCVRVEALPFVAPGTRATRRFARLVSGLCRHMPIDAVARDRNRPQLTPNGRWRELGTVPNSRQMRSTGSGPTSS